MKLEHRKEILLRNLRHWFFPMRCVVCSKLICDMGDGIPLCDACKRSWQSDLMQPCPDCGKISMLCRCTKPRAQQIDAGESSCPDATQDIPFYYLVPYDAHIRNSAAVRYLLYLKTNRDADAFRFLAQEMVELCESAITENTDNGSRSDWIITYAPRSRKSKAENGFDQSEMLARQLSQLLQIPWMSCFQRSNGRNVSQKTLNSAERKDNAQNSYQLVRKAEAALSGKRILLIDDILTTGATLCTCASLLREAGVCRTVCITAARTVYHG